MSHYKIGVIGHTGRGNYGHGLDVVWQTIPGCDLVAVADADPAGRQAAMERLQIKHGYVDYREMLDEAKPDIVSVGPRWIDQHRDMIVACAERGIHVYAEKPFCRDLREADEIVAACEQNDVKFAIAFQTRYSPVLPVVSQLISDGAIGRVLEVRGRGKEDRRGGGEDLWVLGSHVMNLMHHFVGEPNWCFARVLEGGQPISLDHVSPGNEGLGPLTGDNINAMYGFDDGITGYFGSHRNAGPGGTGRFGLRILGSEGQIEVLTGYLPRVHLLQDAVWSPGRSKQSWVEVSSAGVGKPEPLTGDGLHSGNWLACLDLIDAIESDRLPEANVYEARMTVQMILAVFASHLRQAPLEFPLADRRHPLTSKA